MMAAFLLIGIACDNVFVLFDTWYNEKYTVLMHDYVKSKKTNKNLLLDLPANLSHIEMFIQKDRKSFTKETELNANEKQLFIDVEANNTNNNSNGDAHQQPIATGATLDVTDAQNNNTSFLDEDFFDDADTLEFNPIYVRYEPLSEHQMIRVMGGTLRHAASSIFVTSFTTAAAFLTNMITKLPYVQLFGLFTGKFVCDLY
jgi:hypothetical protein